MTISLTFKDAVLSPPPRGLTVILAWPRNGLLGWTPIAWDPAAVTDGEPLQAGDLFWARLPDPSFLTRKEAA